MQLSAVDQHGRQTSLSFTSLGSDFFSAGCIDRQALLTVGNDSSRLTAPAEIEPSYLMVGEKSQI